MKKSVVVILLFLLVFSSVVFFSFRDYKLSSVLITGNAFSGTVNISIDSSKFIFVESPFDTIYNFGVGDNYSIDLNVSANFSVDGWNYSLYDLRHDEAVSGKQNIVFSPNGSFSAVRWENRLIVSAHETGKNWITKTIDFYVEVPNTAPILGNIDSDIYVCEGNSLNYLFNATDADEEDLTVYLSDVNPFYPTFVSRTLNMSFLKIISEVITKGDVGGVNSISKIYGQNVSVKDGNASHIDSALTNITVIEINNVPSLTGIGARTVYMGGENSSFFHQFNASDIEDGVSEDGNMKFNLSWAGGENLFDINSTGYVNYTPIDGHQGNSFALTVCVTDNSLSSAHDNISLCFPRSNVNETICDDFTLTVTDANRAPEILNYSPSISNFSVSGTATNTLSVSVKDSDMDDGFYPDIDWYVNNVLSEHNENKGYDDFSYSAGCGVRGDQNVSVVVSDGLESVMRSWNISVSIVACPVGGSSGGGGGGGSGLGTYCLEAWACDDWDVCQNVKRSFDAGGLSPEDYQQAKEICLQNNYDERFCGFQITTCRDLSNCGNNVFRTPKPSEMRVCYFTENPSCFDGITNCHSGGCELLVDCGGPCGPCPTCSDNRQNQGEFGVDCGGPCPYACEAEVAFGSISFVLISLLVILFGVFIFIIFKLVNILRYRFFFKKGVRR